MVHYSEDGYLLCNGCAGDLVRSDEMHVFKEEGFRDEQTKCAGCGLQVDPVTGNHINELL